MSVRDNATARRTQSQLRGGRDLAGRRSAAFAVQQDIRFAGIEPLDVRGQRTDLDPVERFFGRIVADASRRPKAAPPPIPNQPATARESYFGGVVCGDEGGVVVDGLAGGFTAVSLFGAAFSEGAIAPCGWVVGMPGVVPGAS